MTRSDGERDFLSRWSRLKQDARDEPEPVPAPPAEAPAEAAPGKSEAEILEELGLPDPDTLGPGSDFKAFMAEAVPDWLRRRALRRLWVSDPALANLDMLVDYGEDYTDAATVVANLQSAYKAGRGYLDKLTAEKQAAEAPGEAASAPGAAEGDRAAEDHGAEEPDTRTAAEEDGVDATEPAPEAEEPPTAEAAQPPATAESAEREPRTTHDASAPAPPRRRRMRFDFDES